MSATDISKNLPLTEPTFYIMLCLTPRPQHGYAIMQETEYLSDGRVKLSTSTLYGALKRLLDQGWIERIDEPETSNNGRLRKAYTLSYLGKRILDAEMKRMESLIATANQRLLGVET